MLKKLLSFNLALIYLIISATLLVSTQVWAEYVKWPKCTTFVLESKTWIELWEEHVYPVCEIAPSPDGKTIASVWEASWEKDKKIRIWDVEKEILIDELPGYNPLFSSDGKMLAWREIVEAEEKSQIAVKLRDMETGEVRTLAVWETEAETFIFSSNSKMLAVVTGNVIRLLDIETGKEVRTFQEHTDSIISLAFSPNSKILASSSTDGTIELWDVESGNLIETLMVHSATFAFSSDSKELTVISGVYSPEVMIWDVEIGKVLTTYELGVDTEESPYLDEVKKIALSPDGKLLALGTSSSQWIEEAESVELWNVATGERIDILIWPPGYSDDYNNRFHDISFSPNGGVLAVGGIKTEKWGDTESIVKLWISSTAAPALLEPANNTVVDTNEATLRWEEVDGVYYEVQVAKDGNFQEIILEENTRSSQTSISFPLENKTTYWRVRTHGLGRVGDWSPTWSFETSIPTFLKTKIVKQTGIESTVNVEVEGAKNLSGFQFNLEFDPNLIEVMEVTEGGFFKSDGGSTVWTSPKIDNKSGKITNITSNRISPKGINGSGVLANITFRACKAGSSPLIIKNIKLSDPSATNIPAVGERSKLSFEAVSAFNLETKVDKTITLSIKIKNAIDLHSFSFDLGFEAEALEALEVIKGRFLKQDGAGISFDKWIDNSKGKVSINSRRLEVDGIDGSGVLANITFRIWQGGVLTFYLSNADLTNSNDTPILFTSENIKTTVVESPAWDVNKDYIVDTQDIVILGINFDKKITGNPRPNPDVKPDEVVDVFDVTLIATHFGEEYTALPQESATPVLVKPDSPNLPAPTVTQRAVLQNLYEKLKTYPATNPSVITVKRLLERLLQQSTQPLPKTTQLGQNYPNPFNPETWIPFELAKAANVIIKIYDITGKLVRILSLGHKPVGYYLTKERAAYWNGRNHSGERVSSGMYLYTLTAGEPMTKKLVILK